MNYEVHYYDTGRTDYSTMHPGSFDFWYHMIVPWDFLNWAWLVLGLLYVIVKLNDNLLYIKKD
ncbi:MAG: hypothetical protein CMA64_06625 [Euryarchaeota archaeon]|mgnify:CR=1 FL=1|nr:hypothetical protein [Euryarchaeota archaeon]